MTEDRLVAQMAAYQQCVLDRDQQLADSVLHPDYTLVTTSPRLMVTTRASWLKLLPDYVVHSWNVQEQIVDVANATAAAFQKIEMQATVLGTDRSGQFMISDVWLLDDDWRVWRRHSTALTAGDLPDSSISSSG